MQSRRLQVLGSLPSTIFSRGYHQTIGAGSAFLSFPSTAATARTRTSIHNMPPQQSIRNCQSPTRALSSHPWTQSHPTAAAAGVEAAAAPPPPSSSSLSFSASSPSPPTLIPQLRVRPSSQSSLSNTSSIRAAQIARHLSTNSASAPKMASQYGLRKVGTPYTLEHRVYIEKDGVPVSPFHDIPLYSNAEQTILNMIVEIPRWTNAKLEVSLSSATPPFARPHYLFQTVMTMLTSQPKDLQG